MVNEMEIKYKYDSSDKRIKLFGKKFIENNKNNIEIIINGVKSEISYNYKLKNGENNIKIIIQNKI